MHERRHFLRTSAGLLGALGLAHSGPLRAADAGGIGAPRVALVIGNSAYRDSPLENPVHDARAIAQALGELGFQCQLLTNAPLQAMAEAVQRHGELLAQRKAVGLFYYAGHGAQLAWRNYLVPVDAALRSPQDMPQQTLELNTLLQALKKAANPMNVIILDACRDNPFGASVPLEQKGLSQFDAPTGSLLSYATAPGNTASDGDGANGLFTEHLLREMRVPGARLEDVFKRVRLQVRLKSRGQQIPWESTSLEEDFYFSRPAQLASQLSEEQKAAQFTEELSFWGATRDAAMPEAYSAYLTRYPNGKFTQLAQAQLDVLLKKRGEQKVEVVNAAANPFTKGSSAAVGRYEVGDRYAYERRDALTDVLERSSMDMVTAVTDEQTIFNDGTLVLDLLGNEIKSPNARFLSPAQLFPAEYALGVRWSTTFGWMRGDGIPSSLALDFKVVAREPFSTPAGRFNAFRVEGLGWVIGGGRTTVTYWIDPERCLRPLQMEWIGRNKRNQYQNATRTVLVSYKQKSAPA